MDIALGQVFVIEYHLVGGGAEQVVTKCVGDSMELIGQDLVENGEPAYVM